MEIQFETRLDAFERTTVTDTIIRSDAVLAVIARGLQQLPLAARAVAEPKAARQYAFAAWCYLSAALDRNIGVPDGIPPDWPWEGEAFDPPADYAECLAEAAAFLVAELDRVNRPSFASPSADSSPSAAAQDTSAPPRSEMVDSLAVVALMADDLKRLIRENGEFACITVADLRAEGWSADQVKTFGPAATRLATDPVEN